MARADIAGNGKTYVDPSGTVWEQVTFRKLPIGDYVRVLLEQFGRRLLMQMGHPSAEDPNVLEWRWELTLSIEDAICLVGDLSFGLRHAAVNAAAHIDGAASKVLDLETKVVALAGQVKALKDKET